MSLEEEHHASQMTSKKNMTQSMKRAGTIIVSTVIGTQPLWFFWNRVTPYNTNIAIHCAPSTSLLQLSILALLRPLCY